MENPQYAPDHGAHGSIYRGSGGKTQDQISEKKKQERIKEDRRRLREFIEKERRQAKAARGDSERFRQDIVQEQQRRIEEKRRRAEQQEEERQAKILKAQSDRIAEAQAEREELENVRTAEEIKADLEEGKQQDVEETKDEEKTLSDKELLDMAIVKNAYGLGKLYRDIKRLQERSYEVVEPAYVKQLQDEIMGKANAQQVGLNKALVIGDDDLSKLRSVRYLLLEMVTVGSNRSSRNKEPVLDAWGQKNLDETPAGEDNFSLAIGNALAIGEQPDQNEISFKLENGLRMINLLARTKSKNDFFSAISEDLEKNKAAGLFGRETSIIKNSLHKDTHPMMLAKPAAPQLHMEKLHIQTGPNMKKLDLDTTSEAKEKDVELDDAECGMEHAEMSFKDLKNKGKKMKEKLQKAYKKGKDDLEKGMDKIVKSISSKESEDYLSKKIDEGNLKECDKCGELDDHFHVCAEDLSKPKCISDDIAERKLRELM